MHAKLQFFAILHVRHTFFHDFLQFLGPQGVYLPLIIDLMKELQYLSIPVFQ